MIKTSSSKGPVPANWLAGLGLWSNNYDQLGPPISHGGLCGILHVSIELSQSVRIIYAFQ